MGFLGRCDAKLQRQHVEGLAALWFRQHPGLDSMLEAVRIHREAVQDTCPPAQMCSELKWLNWEQDLCPAAKMSLGKLYMEQAGELGPSKRIQLIVLQLMSCKTIS